MLKIPFIHSQWLTCTSSCAFPTGVFVDHRCNSLRICEISRWLPKMRRIRKSPWLFDNIHTSIFHTTFKECPFPECDLLPASFSRAPPSPLLRTSLPWHQVHQDSARACLTWWKELHCLAPPNSRSMVHKFLAQIKIRQGFNQRIRKKPRTSNWLSHLRQKLSAINNVKRTWPISLYVFLRPLRMLRGLPRGGKVQGRINTAESELMSPWQRSLNVTMCWLCVDLF